MAHDPTDEEIEVELTFEALDLCAVCGTPVISLGEEGVIYVCSTECQLKLAIPPIDEDGNDLVH